MQVYLTARWCKLLVVMGCVTGCTSKERWRADLVPVCCVVSDSMMRVVCVTVRIQRYEVSWTEEQENGQQERSSQACTDTAHHG